MNVAFTITEEELMTIENFNRLYYDLWKRGSGVFDARWLGHQTVKNPLDLWTYQEIIFDRKPDWIIETGTRWGGSAHFFASVCDMQCHGRVISIDNDPTALRPSHQRIDYISGSSTSHETICSVKNSVASDQSVMVVLDSDHSYEHVIQELSLYGEIVTDNQYLVVEDTNLNGHPVRPDFGPGPSEARDHFLQKNKAFIVDEKATRFLITSNPRGFLRKLSDK